MPSFSTKSVSHFSGHKLHVHNCKLIPDSELKNLGFKCALITCQGDVNFNIFQKAIHSALLIHDFLCRFQKHPILFHNNDFVCFYCLNLKNVWQMNREMGLLRMNSKLICVYFWKYKSNSYCCSTDFCVA